MIVEHCRFHLYMYYTYGLCGVQASLHLVKQSTENDRRNRVIGCKRYRNLRNAWADNTYAKYRYRVKRYIEVQLSIAFRSTLRDRDTSGITLLPTNDRSAFTELLSSYPFKRIQSTFATTDFTLSTDR